MPKAKELSKDIDVIASRHDLPPSGVELLKIIVQPEARLMTATEISAMAGISRDTYYRLHKDARFKAAYLETCQTMLLAAAAPASQALAAQAAAGDTMAIKMILELSGLYQQVATLNVNTDDKPSLKDILARKRGSQ